MIELKQDQLVFRFPEVHEDAVLRIEFQRTLRIPDDDRTYPLPPGLGRFPMVHVDDHSGRVPREWLEHGGVLLPMYQSEALWVNFHGQYPFAVRVLTGKIDAVTGKTYEAGLGQGPQNYLSIPRQPWLDGYCVKKGTIRQFVAMPLGSGYSAEEQITGQAEHGGLQLVVYPIKAEVWERIRRRRVESDVVFAMMPAKASMSFLTGSGMGLAPGGRMKQEIYDDPFDLDDWEREVSGRCFVHLANSLVWRSITGREPPTVPPTSKEYAKAKLPWFDYYDERAGAVPGSDILNRLKSVFQLGKEKGDVPLPENESVTAIPVVELRKGLARDEVRQGRF